MTLSRNKQNNIIMIALYDVLSRIKYKEENAPHYDVEALLMGLCEVSSIEEVPQYVRDNVYLTMQHYGEIVNNILPYLRGWSWDRIPLISQAIIIQSYTHYYFYPEKIDKRVAINIAIQQAKLFVDGITPVNDIEITLPCEQANFINALLDKVLK